LWGDTRLLVATGHMPNLSSDSAGERLSAAMTYDFDLSEMSFCARPGGLYQSSHIKLLRLIANTPTAKLGLVDGIQPFIEVCQQLAQTMRKQVLHV